MKNIKKRSMIITLLVILLLLLIGTVTKAENNETVQYSVIMRDMNGFKANKMYKFEYSFVDEDGNEENKSDKGVEWWENATKNGTGTLTIYDETVVIVELEFTYKDGVTKYKLKNVNTVDYGEGRLDIILDNEENKREDAKDFSKKSNGEDYYSLVQNDEYTYTDTELNITIVDSKTSNSAVIISQRDEKGKIISGSTINRKKGNDNSEEIIKDNTIEKVFKASTRYEYKMKDSSGNSIAQVHVMNEDGKITSYVSDLSDEYTIYFMDHGQVNPPAIQEQVDLSKFEELNKASSKQLDNTNHVIELCLVKKENKEENVVQTENIIFDLSNINDFNETITDSKFQVIDLTEESIKQQFIEYVKKILAGQPITDIKIDVLDIKENKIEFATTNIKEGEKTKIGIWQSGCKEIYDWFEYLTILTFEKKADKFECVEMTKYGIKNKSEETLKPTKDSVYLSSSANDVIYDIKANRLAIIQPQMITVEQFINQLVEAKNNKDEFSLEVVKNKISSEYGERYFKCTAFKWIGCSNNDFQNRKS